MAETILGTRELLERAIAADPADVVPQAALADLLVESGEDEAAARRYASALALVHGRGKRAAALRSAVRRAGGGVDRYGRPDPHVGVRVVVGDAQPALTGHGWHYTTPTGRVISYPNAYRRKAKSARLVYHCSTRAVTIGADLVVDLAPDRTPLALATA